MKVWILNHYATLTFVDRAGRHYSFAKHLIEKGYKTTVFCASTVHNMDKQMPLQKDIYGESVLDGIPYVFVKTPSYSGNGKSRIINMLAFAKNVISVAKIKAKKEKPDVIIASSVHPFTCVSGILIAKKLDVPCIVEIRDLWPESIVAYTDRSSKNPAIKFLYKLEKWIYKKADKIIFTMEGGKDYIVDQKWDKANGGPIDLSKVYYINNGVDIEVYDKEIKENPYDDADLDDTETFKVVYAGSIRPANNLQLLVDAAEKLKNKKVKVLIFGDGEDKQRLEQYCEEKGIDNVVFKGRVEKNCIPNILSKSDLNVLNYRRASTWKYGGSQNKLFEYFGSGKPVIANVDIKYSQIKSFSCGISKDIYTAEEYAENIEKIACLEKEEYNEMCKNARLCAEKFDVHILAEKLIDVLES